MTTYTVIRHGSNAANQSITPRMVVGTVEAKNRKEAFTIARDTWKCYVNQYFQVIPWSKTCKADREEAQEQAEATTREQQYLSLLP